MAPKISKEMGDLDWSQPAIVTIRKIRALSGRPGTFTSFRGALLRIHNASLTLMRSEDRTPGEVWSEGSSIYVQSIDGIIEIGEVTPAGKKRMSAVDFMRGARLEPGERLLQQASGASE